MKAFWKEFSRRLFLLVPVVLFGMLVAPIPLFMLYMSTPPYLAKVLVPLLLAGFGALCLCILVNAGIRRWVGRIYLVLCLGAAVFIVHGAWVDHIPTMPDRLTMLHEYEPNAPDTRAVRLEEEPTLKLEGQVLPSMDGATALYPVYAAFAQAVYPEGEYPLYGGGGGIVVSKEATAYQEKYNLVTCTNTVHAYERLINREVDVIFAAAPSQAQLDAAEAAGMELHLTPIGREAFVFFVNSRNPVEGLTVDQVKGIYSGAITSWQEVGGKNWSIRPFQRPENSGSQSALQRLMGDTPILEPLQEDVAGDMGGIISQVASYRNYKNAIGYSFRFYSTQMVENNQIRLLALNGVLPTRETIRDGSYPISSQFYAVTAAPTGMSAPQARNAKLAALLDWILSPQGQWIVDRTGYVSLG
ncbi:MAG: hypothetical protein HFF50_10050 [Lawsonibacter sp.]|nr:hypothetical protein [Lawsonibacter sp.]